MSLEGKTRTGKRVALASIGVSASLAIIKIIIGVLGHSTAVVADGLESAGDVVASGFVLFGFAIAAKPADENHPYGHDRYELSPGGLVVGIILILGGVGISYRSLASIAQVHETPAAFGILPLAISMIAKSILSGVKFRVGRRIGSSALVADAWNDFVDIISAITAMTALGLTLLNPARFSFADHYGGFAVGLIVIFTGLRVAKETSHEAMSTAPVLGMIRSTSLGILGNNIQGY